MNALIIDNLLHVMDRLKDIDEAKNSSFLWVSFEIYLKDLSRIDLVEAINELERVCDTVRINKAKIPTGEVCKKLDVLLPCLDIVEALAAIDNTLRHQTIFQEKIIKSVMKTQTEKINRAKSKLDLL